MEIFSVVRHSTMLVMFWQMIQSKIEDGHTRLHSAFILSTTFIKETGITPQVTSLKSYIANSVESYYDSCDTAGCWEECLSGWTRWWENDEERPSMLNNGRSSRLIHLLHHLCWVCVESQQNVPQLRQNQKKKHADAAQQKKKKQPACFVIVLTVWDDYLATFEQIWSLLNHNVKTVKADAYRQTVVNCSRRQHTKTNKQTTVYWSGPVVQDIGPHIWNTRNWLKD